jgi:hypothetical protein
MSWRFPDEEDIAAAERRVYVRREALRWQTALVTARVRRKLRSRTVVFLAGVAGFALPSVLRTGFGKRLLALAPVLRWVGPVLRLLRT